jgi:hypothetical protein
MEGRGGEAQGVADPPPKKKQDTNVTAQNSSFENGSPDVHVHGQVDDREFESPPGCEGVRMVFNALQCCCFNDTIRIVILMIEKSQYKT